MEILSSYCFTSCCSRITGPLLTGRRVNSLVGQFGCFWFCSERISCPLSFVAHLGVCIIHVSAQMSPPRRTFL